MVYYYGFNKLKFFNLFTEYFIGIMLIFLLVVFIVLISNIYGLLMQQVISQIFSFILFLAMFFLLEECSLFSVQNSLICFNGFSNFLTFSSVSIFSKVIVVISAAVYFLIISNFLADYKLTAFEYLVVLLCAILGLIFLCCTNDFLSSFLSIELISLASYILAAFRKKSTYSLEAGIKYLVVGALSSGFFLLGTSLIYAYTGTIVFSNLVFILENYDFLFKNIFHFFVFYPNNNIIYNYYHNFFINLGVIFVILSIFIKIALSPFHLWSLDVYEASPSISTFFFSTIAKLSFFVFLHKFCVLTFFNFANSWSFYICLVGFFSVFVGCLGGLRQKKLKTLLAYSSISHMGYLLLTFGNFSKLGFEIFFFYIICYIISSIIVWYVVLALKKHSTVLNIKLSKDISDLVLINKTNPFLSFSLTVAFFSLAGIPPLVGFLAKFSIFLALVVEKFYILSLLTILCSIVSTFYYIRIIKILYFENVLIGNLYSFNSQNICFLSIGVFLLIFLFLKPIFLYLLVHKMLFCGYLV